MSLNRRTVLAGTGAVAGTAGCVDRNDEAAVEPTEQTRVPQTDDAGHSGPFDRHRTLVEPVANVKAHGATGDGETDDLAALESAADAVADGGTVYLPPADEEYLVSDTWVIRDDDVNLVGDGDASSIAAAGEMFPVVRHRGDRCTIHNIKVDGKTEAARGLWLDGAEKVVTNCTVVDCHTIDLGDDVEKSRGIVNKGGYTVIANCLVRGIHAIEEFDPDEYTAFPGSCRGIHTTGSQDGRTVIANNVIEDIRYIDDGDGIVVAGESAEVVITGNVFRNVHKSDIKIQGDDITNVLVTDNLMLFDEEEYWKYAGLRVQTGSAVIANNTMRFSRGRETHGGFFIIKDRDVVVTGNECHLEETPGPGANFDGVRIQKGLYQDDEPTSNVTISDNVLSGCVDGILAEHGYRDVKIDNNLVTDIQGDGVRLISDGVAEDVTITNNTLKTSAENAAIDADAGGPYVVTGNLTRSGDGIDLPDDAETVVGLNYDGQPE